MGGSSLANEKAAASVDGRDKRAERPNGELNTPNEITGNLGGGSARVDANITIMFMYLLTTITTTKTLG